MGNKWRWTAGQIALLVVIVVAGLVVSLVFLPLPAGPPERFVRFVPGAAMGSQVTPTMASADCTKEAAPFLKEIELLAREWDDARQLADRTPRASLTPQIRSLQALRRKIEDLEVPYCAAGVRQSLIGTMETTTQGFMAFFGQLPDDEVSALFAIATERHEFFDTAIAQLRAGKPVPTAGPIFYDGIGIDRATLQKAYPAYTFAHIGTDPNLFIGTFKEDKIEIAGPAENLRSADISLPMMGGSGDRLNRITQSLHAFLKLITPDWSDGDAWLTAAMKQNGKQVISIRGRVVSYERTSTGGTDVFRLLISVPYAFL